MEVAKSKTDVAGNRRWLDWLCHYPATVTGTLVFLTAIVLRWLGQPLWCEVGDLTPWSWDIWSAHNSQHPIDPYFFTHVLHGMVFYGILHWTLGQSPIATRFIVAMLIESLWEVFENSPMVIQRYRQTTISLDYVGDSVANAIFDIVACGIGYAIAFKLGWRSSTFVFFATEAVLIATIRDSLILNIVMLVCPIESLKQWQMYH